MGLFKPLFGGNRLPSWSINLLLGIFMATICGAFVFTNRNTYENRMIAEFNRDVALSAYTASLEYGALYNRCMGSHRSLPESLDSKMTFNFWFKYVGAGLRFKYAVSDGKLTLPMTAKAKQLIGYIDNSINFDTCKNKLLKVKPEVFENLSTALIDEITKDSQWRLNSLRRFYTHA